jgi:ABC-2 type transport system ATP-binding protein
MPIELDRLSHHYGDRLALDNLSFAVQPAEIFGLLGPNGSGKTTLFRILSTLMVPTGGTARIEGFDVAREPNRARQQTGIVFQARSLDLKLTVLENLKHQGHLYGLRGETLKSRSAEVLRRPCCCSTSHLPALTPVPAVTCGSTCEPCVTRRGSRSW